MFRNESIIFCTFLIFFLSTTHANQSNEPLNWGFQPGDAVSISAAPDTGFPNGIYPVDGRGYVDLPIVGFVKMTEISKDDFIKIVSSAYIGYVKQPHFGIRRLVRISLLGGFQKPGLYWISPDATMWNAIYLAGGTIREDGISQLRWERDGKVLKKHLIEEFQSGKTLEMIGFESGDQIMVTSHLKMTVWDIIRQDLLPVLSISVSIFAASLTLSRQNR